MPRGGRRRVFGLFDDRIEHDEPAAVFEHAQYFGDNARGIAEMVQAERHESAVERAGFKRQLVGFAGALCVVCDGIFVLVADVEHRHRFIDADERPFAIALDNGHATRPVPVATSRISSSPLSVSASINLVVR